MMDCQLICSKIFERQDSELQLAAFNISAVEIPVEAATEDEAPLTEWALKIEVSMPDASNSDFSHRATVLEEIASLMRFDHCYQQFGLLAPKELSSLLIGFEHCNRAQLWIICQ